MANAILPEIFSLPPINSCWPLALPVIIDIVRISDGDRAIGLGGLPFLHRSRSVLEIYSPGLGGSSRTSRDVEAIYTIDLLQHLRMLSNLATEFSKDSVGGRIHRWPQQQKDRYHAAC